MGDGVCFSKTSERCHSICIVVRKASISSIRDIVCLSIVTLFGIRVIEISFEGLQIRW